MLQAQSIQWSQYTGQNVGSQTYARAVFVEKSLDGSIYVVGAISGNNPPPTFPTSDVIYRGSAYINNYNAPIHLSKYSSDGKLLWVRILNGSSIQPAGLSLSPSGEPVILYVTGSANADYITPDAWRPNPPSFASFGNTAVLNKFDVNGNLAYGTYIGPVNGSLFIEGNSSSGNTYTAFDGVQIAPDGTTYVVLSLYVDSEYTGVMPTTPGAFQTDAVKVSGVGLADVIMIFKPDNTLQYSSYFSYQFQTKSASALSNSGDLYYLQSATNLLSLPTPPVNAAKTALDSSYIMRLDKNGNITASTYLGGLTGTITTNPVNGDVITMNTASGRVQVFDADLTTLKSVSTPFAFTGPNDNDIFTRLGVDNFGRLHALVSGGEFAGIENLPVITPGAIQTVAINQKERAYYGIADCNFQKTIYGTFLSDQNTQSSSRTALNDLELDQNCNAYIVGAILPGTGFPVTPLAYNDNGTATLSGFDVSVTSIVSDGFLTKFNYPILKTGTNQLATPAITTFCSGSGALAIDGTKASYLTPILAGNVAGNPAPTPLHYQWQVATAPSGPWTNISNTDVEDYVPANPASPGTYYYRRLVRQTSFDIAANCVPSCDVAYASNVISLTFSTNQTHTTDLSAKKYGFCKGSTLAVSANLSPSIDGNQGPYNYKLTTFTDLVTVVAGQSGTLASAPGVINLSISQPGQYLLQVTDSRGCISFDTLNAEHLKVNAGSRILYTCGASSVTFGPSSLVTEYANYANNILSWSPTTGLSNPSVLSPTLSILPAVGASADYYLTLNGCPVDTITVSNQSVNPLPSLPALSLCQGDTAILGQGITAQTGVTYEWAPGLGLTATNVPNPIVTTAYAPAGVNVTSYTLKAQNGTTSCVQYTTQQVTVYRTPNQSFQIKICLQNGCDTTRGLGLPNIGTISEPGIAYSWQAIIVPGTATTGLPSPTDVTNGLANPTGSVTDFSFLTASLGRANGTYTIQLIRTSQNTANPACMRTDTAFLNYCICGNAGDGGLCALAIGALPTIVCGGATNKIGPIQYTSGGTYIWSRLDGQPLNNELFDIYTNQPLTDGGPHSNQVFANPTGLTAVSYRLTIINPGSDTCRVDIKVFPAAIGKPNVTYISPQSVCQGSPYTIQGPAANPNLIYKWEPVSLLVNQADSISALPTIKSLIADQIMFVTVTDTTTGCSVQDTVQLVVTPVQVNAGNNATFCVSGTTVNIGGLAALPGYSYQWTAIPSAGVSFGNATAAQTTATLPATSAGGTITLILTATNGQTSANCTLSDTVVFRAAATPAVTIPPAFSLCSGGQVIIGPVSPSDLTYAWSGPGIVGSTTGSAVTVNAVGTYTVVISQGSCSTSRNVTISAATTPTVTPNPAAPCSGPVTIGVNNVPGTEWSYSWDKLDGLKGYTTGFATISVEPAITTTYTLTATHISGCTLTFPITVPAAAYSASLPSSLSFCEGQTAVLPLNDPSAVSGTVSWSASPVEALAYLSSPTAINPTIDLSAAPAGSYTYTATVTYGAGCQSMASTTVTIGKKIEGIAGLDAQICNGTCTTLGIDAVAGINYEWSSSSGTVISAANSARPTVCPTQNTTFTLKYYSASGCVFTDDVLVQVLPSPSLTVQDLSACQNDNGTATINLANGVVSTTGSSLSYWLNASATIAAPNPVNAQGTYYIKASDGTCSTIKPVTVTFNDTPSAISEAFFNCDTQTGTIRLTNVTSNARYDYSLGNTYTGNKTYASASVIPGSGIIVSNLIIPFNTTQSYTVRLFGSDGTCFRDITVQITNTKPDAGANQNICAPATTATLTAITLGGTWTAQAGNPAAATVTSSGAVSGMSANGTYNFIYTLNGCTDTVSVVRNPKPDAGSDQSICAPTTTATLTAITAGGTWTAQAGNPAAATVTSAGAVSGMSANGTYNFIYTLNGCTDTVSVVRNPKPDAGANQNICAPATTATLTAITAGGTWTAQAGNPAAATVTSAGAVSGMTANGTYNFIYTLNGCTDTVSVVRNPKPDAGANQNICAPATTATLTAITAGGTWTAQAGNPAAATVTSAGAVSGMSANGTYNFIYTLNGCTDTVSVVRNPKPDAGANQNICAPATTATLTAITAGGTWTAQAGNPAAATVTSAGAVSGMSANGTYKFIYTLNGCTDTVSVIRNPQPIQVNLSPAVICENQSLTYTDASGTNGTWSGPGVSDTGTGATVSGAAALTQLGQSAPTSFYIYYTQILGECSRTDSGLVSINPRPLVSITGPTLVCGNELPVSFTGSPAGGTFTLPQGLPVGAVTISNNVATLNAGFNIASLTFSYQFTDATTGCSNTDSHSITVTPAPNAGPDQTLACVNPVTNTLQTTTTLTGAPSGGTWSAQSGNPASAMVTNAGVVTGMSMAGTYQFIYTLNDCSDTVSVTVSPCQGCVKPNAGNDQSICSPTTTATLTAITSGGTWNAQSGNPVSATITNAGAVAGMTVDGTYRFIYSVTSGGETCTDTVSVVRNPKPNAGANQNICAPATTATLTAITAGGTWTAQAGNPAAATVTSAGAVSGMTANGTYNFIYTLNGCTDTVSVVRNPKPDAGSDQSVCAPTTTATLTAITAGGTWTAQAGNPAAATVTSAGAVSGMTANGTYNFIYTLNGCTDTVSVVRNLKPDAGVDQTLTCPPSGISPTTATLSGAPSGGVWSTLASNPAAATVTNAGAVSGMTVAGTYQFIYTLNNCADTVQIEVPTCIVPVFDLALRKTLATGQSASVVAGSNVTFTITVFNQGNVDATNIQVTDYIPTGLTLNDANWTATAGVATLNTVIASLPAGQSTTRDITFVVSTGFTGSISNLAEISSATGGTDVDSSPDSNPANDGTPKNDVINENGLTGGDEDDHDPEVITVTPAPVFDLALRKTLATGQSASVVAGSNVTFTITVFNQGNVDATNIQVTDYIPTGLTLNDANWTATAGVATLNTVIASLPAGQSTTRDITFVVSTGFTGSISNLAEISSATGGTDVDSSPDNNPANDGTPKNDVINENGLTGGDEDDHDPEVITVTPPAQVDLSLKKLINTKIAQLGDTLTYTIKVFNQSATLATGVEVTDSLATSVQFINGSFTSTRGTAAITNNVIIWNIGNIAASGDTVTLTYKVKAIQEGVHFNTAEITKTNEGDIDSTPGNGNNVEDDNDQQCFTVPFKLCPLEKVQASVPAYLTNVQWYKDGGSTPIVSGNTVLFSEVGTYTFTASNQQCPAEGCCPIIIEAGNNCCPTQICIPFTINKKKK
ncbi:hypothetical protein DR864_13510 [Runella rosea]|uniref:DUF11 domain-containing protein n=2 Tax=Runella rosea TaxID=2259595 RepID=A0A344TJ76_9BACT|nr:hypothetical protein DR864_13510 [Runella rosea]